MYPAFYILEGDVEEMEMFKSILVIRDNNDTQVKVIQNPTSYPLIGKGFQGAVFKIAPKRCIKVFASKEDCLKERKALKKLQRSSIAPRVYEVGAKYIVLEYIKGISLEEYLTSKGFITRTLTKQILYILKEMERLKLTRIDAALRHIIISKQKEFKVIDHVNSFTKRWSKPRILFRELKQLGLLSSFLEQVKEVSLDTYHKWKKL